MNNTISCKQINVQLAFKPIDKNKSWVGKVISFWTRSVYYHVELILDKYWISSNADEKGVTIKELKPLKYNWEYKDLGTITLTEEQYHKIISFIESQRSKKYDWLGIIFSQTFPFKWHSRNKWFCSEIVTKILQLLLVEEVINKDPTDMSPADIAKLFHFDRRS